MTYDKFMCSVGIAYRVAWESEGTIPRLTLIIDHLKLIMYETAYTLEKDLYEQNGLYSDLERVVEGFTFMDDDYEEFQYEPKVDLGEVMDALAMFHYAYIFNLNSKCPVVNEAQQSFILLK